MEIDIIIPIFNRAYCLKRTIDSVLAQSYPNWRLWAVNDGSTDETSSILKTYAKLDQRIQIVETVNGGVSLARNIGVQQGIAPWIAFLDSDDEWLPEKLEIQMNFTTHSPQSKFVFCDEIWIRNNKQVQQKAHQKKQGGNLFLRSLETCLIGASTVIMKRDLYQEMKGFDISYPVCEDYNLWLKILSLYEVDFISRPLVKKYGGHPDQLSTQFKAMDLWRIKSLEWILENRTLSPSDSEAVRAELVKKAEILALGYEKYRHQEKLAEIQTLLVKYKN